MRISAGSPRSPSSIRICAPVTRPGSSKGCGSARRLSGGGGRRGGGGVGGAGEGDLFFSRDGKERPLGADTLMICDGVKPVAVGGVMGGLNSEVQSDTETILLESAYFDPSPLPR